MVCSFEGAKHAPVGDGETAASLRTFANIRARRTVNLVDFRFIPAASRGHARALRAQLWQLPMVSAGFRVVRRLTWAARLGLIGPAESRGFGSVVSVMRKLMLASAMMALLAVPAAAQVTDPTVPHDEADTIAPKTSYPLGDSEAVARSMLLSMKIAQKQRDLCWELGCLVIVNESQSYEVTGFFVQMTRKDGTLGWSNNQFGMPLMPKRATFRFKSGGSDACNQPVKFVMKKHKT